MAITGYDFLKVFGRGTGDTILAQRRCVACGGWGKRPHPIKEWGETAFMTCESCDGTGQAK